jgi:hypothetical protein
MITLFVSARTINMTTCNKCQEECEVVFVEEPFMDEAFGMRQLILERIAYSECCGAGVSDNDEV